jgi:hypothetical protein
MKGQGKAAPHIVVMAVMGTTSTLSARENTKMPMSAGKTGAQLPPWVRPGLGRSHSSVFAQPSRQAT